MAKKQNVAQKELCIHCAAPLKKAFIAYRGARLEARQCPKCGERVFTEALTLKAISAIEAHRLKKEYAKHPIRIGHSWGITFPKEIAAAFQLHQKRALRVHPDIERGKIEIAVA